MKIEAMKPMVNREVVLQIIGCTPESSAYPAMTEAYDRLLPKVLARANCRYLFARGRLESADAVPDCPAGTDVLYVIATVGAKLSEFSSELFAGDAYVDGMLADAMADSMLFEMERQWNEDLKQFCRQQHIGIKKRMEAPTELPLHVQRTAFDYLHAQEMLDMRITSAHMYEPVKSVCVVFQVSDDSCQFHAEHDCNKCPAVNCSMRKRKEEHAFEVLDAFAEPEEKQRQLKKQGKRLLKSDKASCENFLGIAIDIGTTTLAARLLDLSSGKTLASAVSMNRQRTIGVDVISRIEAANRGKEQQLKELIEADLRKLFHALLEQAKADAAALQQIILSGNTTMGHLLLGYSCEGLGSFPFRPVNLELVHKTYQDSCDVWLMSGISAYVGGDIVSGLYACDFDRSEEINLFIDLGTNGEMALGNSHRLLTTSVAAGPAFEGGNISCGTGSISGAISHVHIEADGRISLETIQNQIPVGICGTGIIELTAELFKTGQIDETGLLAEAYFEEGYPVTITPQGNEITFTQRDIREVQMAKSAVRAGVEILLKRYGIGYETIAHVYLAGGMGFSLNSDAAVSIGLLPVQLKDKLLTVGNTSLAGAVRALTDEHWQERVQKIRQISKELVLANEPEFPAYYVKYMMFGENNQGCN